MTNKMNYDEELEQTVEDYMESMNREYDTAISTKDMVKAVEKNINQDVLQTKSISGIVDGQETQFFTVNMNDPLTGTSKRQRVALDETTNIIGKPYDYGTILM